LKALNRMFDAGPEGFEGGMTNRKYANLTKASPATAQRDLADLVSKGCLVLAGSGRSAHYELATSTWFQGSRNPGNPSTAGSSA
jgi:Fic family protein